MGIFQILVPNLNFKPQLFFLNLKNIMSRKLIVVIVVLTCVFAIYIFWSSFLKSNITFEPKVENIKEENLLQESLKENDLDTATLDDCSIEIPLNLIDDTSFDPENKTVTVYWTDIETQGNVKHTFLFTPETGFVGCSESVKTKFNEIEKMNSEVYGNGY